MEDQRFKTMRHIEAVRNHIDMFIRFLMHRAEKHDQSKLEAPEREYFDKYTPLLRDLEYGSEEYKSCLREMKPAIEHHNRHNSHHPEHFQNGILDMNLADIVEMLCDWRAASMRHETGDIYKSIQINQKRFGFSDDLARILKNTASSFEMASPFTRADES